MLRVIDKTCSVETFINFTFQKDILFFSYYQVYMNLISDNLLKYIDHKH